MSSACSEGSEAHRKPGEGIEFTETGPRPPTLPGREQDSGGGGVREGTPAAKNLTCHKSERGGGGMAAALPSLLTPRKSNLHGFKLSQLLPLVAMTSFTSSGKKVEGGNGSSGQKGTSEGGGVGGGGEEVEPPLGYEPEGSVRTTPPFSEATTTSTMPCLMWNQGLRNLLRDMEGVELFRRYVQQENCKDSLDFWFACEGLKKQPLDNPEHIQQLIKVIYRKYIRSQITISLNAATRKTITEKMGATDKSPDRCIFDGAQREAEQHMERSIYLNFLQSDIYLQYVRCMENGPAEDPTSPKCGDASTSASVSACCSLPSSRSSSSGGRLDVAGPLPTVMEDCELNVSTRLPLTLRHLHATEKLRVGYSNVRRPEAHAGLYLQQTSAKARNPYHATYAAFVPSSAQDSELQSLSSGAHTDDTISLTDSSVDGASTNANRMALYMKQQHRNMRKNANQNREPLSHNTLIPRLQNRLLEHSNSNLPPKDPTEFAKVLIQKLEVVKRMQECEEKVAEKILESECDVEAKSHAANVPSAGPPLEPLSSILLNAAMREKLAISDDTDQSILDDHVSRIWSDSVHQSPVLSPGRHSPPERRRVSALVPVPNPYATTKNPYFNTHPHHRHRKDKDVASMLSSDSGAMPDIGDAVGSSVGSGALPGGSGTSAGFGHHNKHGYHHSAKSKGLAECGIDHSRTTMLDSGFSGSGSGGCGEQQRRSKETSKRSSGKKSFLDSSSSGIDSGVSLAYEPNSQGVPTFNSQEKVLIWVLENEKYSVSHPSDSEKDSSSRHKKSTYSSLSTTSPGPNRQGRVKKAVAYNASRSESLERGGHTSRLGSLPQPHPQQPIMGDPLMPLLPHPSTTTQLEEAKRRLEGDTKNKLAKSKSGLSGKDRCMYLDLAKGSGLASNKLPLPGTPWDGSEEGVSNPKKSSRKSLSTSVSMVATTPTGSSADGDYTVVGYHFSAESVPYRSKLPGKNIVLKQFKSLVTKKGNFRYFFKRASDEFGTGTVFEEVCDDYEVLPLWEGKIFARIESID